MITQFVYLINKLLQIELLLIFQQGTSHISVNWTYKALLLFLCATSNYLHCCYPLVSKYVLTTQCSVYILLSKTIMYDYCTYFKNHLQTKLVVSLIFKTLLDLFGSHVKTHFHTLFCSFHSLSDFIT